MPLFMPSLLLTLANWLAFASWWIGLGILSSIGIGFGVHTGVLFVFPYIVTELLLMENHASSFSQVYGPLWLKIAPACYLWGLGSALGEIPPYMLARYGSRSTETLAIEMAAVSPYWLINIINRAIYYCQKWTIALLQKYGRLAIFLLASWPNATFDLCGMACGYFQYPFWYFFGPTLIGKALVEVHWPNIVFAVIIFPPYLRLYYTLFYRPR